MLFGLFSSDEQKIKKNNMRLLQQATSIYERQRLIFRDNAVQKLQFRFPDVKLCFTSQCSVFAGYSEASKSFFWGQFFDDFLPDLEELRACLDSPDFPKLAEAFVEKVNHYRAPKIYTAISYNSREDGYALCCDDFLFGLDLTKNGTRVTRSSVGKPTPKGYLSQMLYESVVQDIKGTGVSTLSVCLHIRDLGGRSIEKEIFLAYVDSPRRSEHQSREHYLNVCRIFQPFLEAIENAFQSQEYKSADSDDARFIRKLENFSRDARKFADERPS